MTRLKYLPSNEDSEIWNRGSIYFIFEWEQALHGQYSTNKVKLLYIRNIKSNLKVIIRVNPLLHSLSFALSRLIDNRT